MEENYFESMTDEEARELVRRASVVSRRARIDESSAASRLVLYRQRGMGWDDAERAVIEGVRRSYPTPVGVQQDLARSRMIIRGQEHVYEEILEWSLAIERRSMMRMTRGEAEARLMRMWEEEGPIPEGRIRVSVADLGQRILTDLGISEPLQDLERHPERQLRPVVALEVEPEGDITGRVPDNGGRYFVRPSDQLEATTIRLVLDLLTGTRHIHDVARKQSDALAYIVVDHSSPITPYTTFSPLRQLALEALRPGMEYNRNLASSLMDEIASEWGFSWSETPDEPVTKKWIMLGGDFATVSTEYQLVMTQRGGNGVMPIRLYFGLDPRTAVVSSWGLIFNDAGSSQPIRSIPTVRQVLRLCDTLGIPLKERR